MNNPSPETGHLLDAMRNGEGSVRTDAATQLYRIGAAQGAPLILDHSRVLFLYKGEAENVGIIGDMTEWSRTDRFSRIPGGNVFYHLAEFPPEARLEYWMVIDGEQFVPDPLNPYRLWNGIGPVSELAMPRYLRHPYFSEYEEGRKGELDILARYELGPGALDYSHEIYVFHPGPEHSAGPLNSIYFQDGADYVEFAQAAVVMKRMIEDRLMPPALGIFVCPPNRHLPATPNRMTEYGMNDDYLTFFVSELVPFIDGQYPTQRHPSARLVVGDSYGGLISMYIGLQSPGVFGKIYSQSGYLSFEGGRLCRLIEAGEPASTRIYLDVGHYERVVAADILPADETDFLHANRQVEQLFCQRGYDCRYREYPEGHTWGNWRRHLVDALAHFFGEEGG